VVSGGMPGVRGEGWRVGTFALNLGKGGNEQVVVLCGCLKVLSKHRSQMIYKYSKRGVYMVE